jgi:Mg-chelatase subunit ChlI
MQPTNYHSRVFPFSALVGQDLLKLGLVLQAVNPHLGGILVRGHKGTAKSTAARALPGLWPSSCPR